MAISSDRRRKVAAAVKGLGLRTSAERLLTLRPELRTEFAKWLRESFPEGSPLQEKMVRELADAVAPSRGRKPWWSLGIIRAAQLGKIPANLARRPTRLTELARRGRPPSTVATIREEFVRAVDGEAAKQGRLLRSGGKGEIRAAVTVYLRRRGLPIDKLSVKKWAQRYRRWKSGE